MKLLERLDSSAHQKENFSFRAGSRAMELRAATEDAVSCLGRKNILCQQPLCSSFALV